LACGKASPAPSVNRSAVTFFSAMREILKSPKPRNTDKADLCRGRNRSNETRDKAPALASRSGMANERTEHADR
jgi:hypothetical protein